MGLGSAHIFIPRGVSFRECMAISTDTGDRFGGRVFSSDEEDGIAKYLNKNPKGITHTTYKT